MAALPPPPPPPPIALPPQQPQPQPNPPHPNPPPIALPPQPNDPNVQLPVAPAFPPTVNDAPAAAKFHQNVDLSIAERPLATRCTSDDSVLYEHGVVAQAVAVAGPQAVAPPWFQEAVQQLRTDLRNDMRVMLRSQILPDLKRLMNQRRGDGTVVPFEVIPFVNGNDPTQPPNNLPPLHSVNAIENLTGPILVQYLNGYGTVAPIGPNPHSTNRLRKETLKSLVGALA